MSVSLFCYCLEDGKHDVSLLSISLGCSFPCWPSVGGIYKEHPQFMGIVGEDWRACTSLLRVANGQEVELNCCDRDSP